MENNSNKDLFNCSVKIWGDHYIQDNYIFDPILLDFFPFAQKLDNYSGTYH